MSSRCRAAALRSLKVRPRSIGELRDKLEAKKFEPQEISDTIEFLETINLLDDRAFTASWIQYRLARPFGFRRIITELKQKGVSDAIIAEAVANAKGGYDEADVVLELAERRAKRLSGIDPLKRKKRVFDYLVRRGYPIDIVIKTIKKLSS